MDKVERIEIRLHQDDRGWVAWPVAETDLEHLRLSRFHVPCLKPGAVRGNHYHQNSIEFAFILSGPCRALFEDNETGEQQEVMVEGSAPVLFKIAPKVTHAFKNESLHDIFLLCYEQRADSNHEEDICRKTIL